MANYGNTSNYSTTAINKKYLDIYSPRATGDRLSTDTKKVRIGNRYDRRPDLMAYDLYGSARYWWIFAHYNMDTLKDPLNDFRAGTIIEVPSKQAAVGVS